MQGRRQTNHGRHAGSGVRGGPSGTRRGRGGGRGGMAARGRGFNMHMFVTRDMEPRNQHDMRAFVMAARLHAETQKLSEVGCDGKNYRTRARQFVVVVVVVVVAGCCR